MMKRLLMLSTLFALSLAAAQPSRPGWLGLGFSHEIRGDEQWLQVLMVLPNGPGATAGIRAGDAITAINGKPLRFRDSVEMLEFLGRNRPGDRITLSVTRGATKMRVILVTTPMTDEQYERWKLNLELAKKQRDQGRR